jgi:hypothetical protein
MTPFSIPIMDVDGVERNQMKLSKNLIKEDKRQTTLSAKKAIDVYCTTKDLWRFAHDVSELSQWFGRYCYRNRRLFLLALKDEIERRRL